MHQESIRKRIALEEEIRQLTNETNALQDENNDLQRSAISWMDSAIEQGELYDDCEAQLARQLVTREESETQLQDLRNEIQDLRETNGDPQNENADLRIENRRLRNQVQPLPRGREALFIGIGRLRERVTNLQNQVRGAQDAEDDEDRLREQIRDTAEEK